MNDYSCLLKEFILPIGLMVLLVRNFAQWMLDLVDQVEVRELLKVPLSNLQKVILVLKPVDLLTYSEMISVEHVAVNYGKMYQIDQQKKLNVSNFPVILEVGGSNRKQP